MEILNKKIGHLLSNTGIWSLPTHFKAPTNLSKNANTALFRNSLAKNEALTGILSLCFKVTISLTDTVYKVTKICQVQSRVSYQERDRLHIFSKTVVARPTWQGKSSYSICLLMFLKIKLSISYGQYLLFTSNFISIHNYFVIFHSFSKKKQNLESMQALLLLFI